MKQLSALSLEIKIISNPSLEYIRFFKMIIVITSVVKTITDIPKMKNKTVWLFPAMDFASDAASLLTTQAPLPFGLCPAWPVFSQ